VTGEYVLEPVEKLQVGDRYAALGTDKECLAKVDGIRRDGTLCYWVRYVLADGREGNELFLPGESVSIRKGEGQLAQEAGRT
jgi:hypothetical protein